MKKLNIGMDIDQTMYFLDVVEQASYLLGLEYTSKDVAHWIYDKEEINGFPKNFCDLIFAHFDDPTYMGSLKLCKNVWTQLKEWKEKGHHLYVISARRPLVQVATIKMLNKDFGTAYFDGIHFVEHKTNAKTELFEKLKLDVWIDDNPKDIWNSWKHWIKTYAIYNPNTKYNRKRIKEILDIEKKLPVDEKYLITVKDFGEINL